MDGLVLFVNVWVAEFDLARVSLEHGLEGFYHWNQGWSFSHCVENLRECQR
jgi:hypothetical protein